MIYKNKQPYFFEVNQIYLYSKTGYLILQHCEDYIYNDISYINIRKILPIIVKNLCKMNSKNHKDIIFNIFIYGNVNILMLNIKCTNIISIAVLSQRTNIKLIKFFLLKLTLSFLNYLNMNHCISLFNLYTKMYENFLISPLIKHFSLNIKHLFRRCVLYINNISYKSYYLVDLSTDNIIFSGQSLYKSYICEEIKMPDKAIWKEILFHSHKLKNDYILKNGNLLKIANIEDFFVKLEYRSTFPRITFVIKFLPLLEGLALVHQYKQPRLSRYDGDVGKGYRELDISYGYYYTEGSVFKEKNNECDCLLNGHELLVNINYYFMECLMCNLSTMGFFIAGEIEKIYFSKEVLTRINQCINKYILSKRLRIVEDITYGDYVNLNKIIIAALYEDYIQSNDAENEVKQTKLFHNQTEDLVEKLYLKNFPDSMRISQFLALDTLFKSEEISKFVNKEDLSMNLSINDGKEGQFVDHIKYKYNTKETPERKYGFHYLHGTKENRELVDLVEDNFSFYENVGMFRNSIYGVCYPMLYKKSLVSPEYQSMTIYYNNIDNSLNQAELINIKKNYLDNDNKENDNLFDTDLSDISSGVKYYGSSRNKIINCNKRLNSVEQLQSLNDYKLPSLNKTPVSILNVK